MIPRDTHECQEPAGITFCCVEARRIPGFSRLVIDVRANVIFRTFTNGRRPDPGVYKVLLLSRRQDGCQRP